jgi:hypothetical protein
MIIRAWLGQSNRKQETMSRRRILWRISNDERSNKMAGCTTLKRASRSTTVLLSLTAWFFLSNHCALAVISSSAEASPETGGCPLHSAPAKKKPAPKTPCCKEVRAVVAKCIQVAGLGMRLIGSRDYAPEIFLRPSGEAIEIDGLDTGPPGRFSFAELVLQESMLAHAPPVS